MDVEAAAGRVIGPARRLTTRLAGPVPVPCTRIPLRPCRGKPVFSAYPLAVAMLSRTVMPVRSARRAWVVTADPDCPALPANSSARMIVKSGAPHAGTGNNGLCVVQDSVAPACQMNEFQQSAEESGARTLQCQGVLAAVAVDCDDADAPARATKHGRAHLSSRLV
jgi:hypothetical protein